MALQEKIFFKTVDILCGPDEEKATIQVSELMPAGALLAAIEDNENTAPPASANAQKQLLLVPGKHVHFSADGVSLLASQPGYPSISRETDTTVEKIIIDLEPLFSISADNWSVKMMLYPSPDETPLPDASEIAAMLKSTGVCFGIRTKNIEGALNVVSQQQQPIKDCIVARGRLPVNGENGRLRLAIDTESQPGKKLKDGRIDFRERRLFIGVDKGQLLATLLPATAGLAGINVFGQEIPQIPGKDLTLKSGTDIQYDPATGEIRAAFPGVLSVINDTSVKISSKHVISGDIDYSTGNIDSRDAVQISGSVKPGFTVMGGGDIVIGGNVEAAKIIGRANVILRGGLLQKGGSIYAEGDIDMAFCQNGSVAGGGSIMVRREVYFSEIESNGNITCVGEAKVIASELCAGGSIHVTDVDTESSPNSFLAAATAPKRYRRYLRLLQNVHLLQAKIDRLQHRLGPDARNEDLDELKEEFTDAMTELTSFNLVPAAPEKDRSSALRYTCKQKIVCNGTIRPGTVIRLGNSEATLKNQYSCGYFILNSDTEEIEFHSDDQNSKISAEAL